MTINNTNKSTAFLNVFVLDARGEQISVGGVGLQIGKQLDRSLLKLSDDRINSLKYQFQLNVGTNNGLLDLGVELDQSLAQYQSTAAVPADGWLNVSVIDANGKARRLGGIKLVMSNMVHRTLIAAMENFDKLKFVTSIYRLQQATEVIEFVNEYAEQIGNIDELSIAELEAIDRSNLVPAEKAKITRRINKLKAVDTELAELSKDDLLPF